ncbi:MAG: VWA domain-containing protein [Azoarcus sp.]|jgi:Ca-activated chloride channel family protein|nr:VWA domain-containing protein [Azoarcus sp.]
MKNIFALLAFSSLFLLMACEQDGSNAQGQASESNALTVLAGSELKDIEALLPGIAKATGISLQLKYAGTLDAVERLAAGEDYDLAWLASNRYAMLTPEVKARIAASERTMLTPVVLGIKERKAKALGWIDDPDITWKDIAEAAKQGKFTFGMTSPTSSNTGFSALLGLAAALSGKGDALEAKDIDMESLVAFFKAQRLTSGSSGWLAEAYRDDQDKVDGLINYSSSLQMLNRDSRIRQKLALIYPRDGIVTADYPIMLLDAAKRDAYGKLVAYLHGATFQRAMTRATLRNPVNPDIPSAAQVPSRPLAELPFPAGRGVVDVILSAFDNELRLPADSTFVMDVSGSMNGRRIENLKKAMLNLAGADDTVSGRFTRFRNRERIYLLPFNNSFGRPEYFDMGSAPQFNRETLEKLGRYVRNLRARGGTAIFLAAREAYREAALRRRDAPDRFYSIVLMTDGQNNQGIDMDGFMRWYRELPEADKGIRIFPILFGEADPKELQQLAELTTGKVFDGRKSGLPAIFKEIRGYQ